MKNQKGFSLVELLVVVIIIAIIAAIAIPSLLASRRAANEASAISALRTMHSAQMTYFSTAGGNSAYGSLANLASTGVDLIDDTLASATSSPNAKSGYFYTVTTATASFCILGEPSSTTQGTRTFGIATEGVLRASDADGTDDPTCAAGPPAVLGATGNVIQ